METLFDVGRFFDSKEFEKEVKLTQEEAKVLSDFEVEDVYCNGLHGISGGFACVTLKEFDEEDGSLILGTIKSGVQSDCENVVYTDGIIFNRKDKTIGFE